MKKNFNHSPFVCGIEVPLNGYRFKDPYFILNKDGSRHDAYPNGGGWSVNGGKIFEDEDVSHITLSGTAESSWERMTGGWRLARDIDYFGKNYPIWCGKEYGFLYPDEIPAGKVVVPVRMFAHRKKYTTEITLFVAQGKIVDFDKSTDYPTPANITPYLDHPAFWMDPNAEVMCSEEIILSMHYIECFKRTLIMDENDSKSLIKIFDDINIDAVSYVPNFSRHLKMYKENKVCIKTYPDVLRERFITANVYLKDNAKTNEMSSFYNTRRSPEVNKVDSPDWDMFSKALIDPLGNFYSPKSLVQVTSGE